MVWLLLAGCGGAPTPHWALDTFYAEPVGDGISGVATWEIFGKKWARKQDEKHFVCAVVVEIEGDANPCDPSLCQAAWTVSTNLLESDCTDETATDPLFVSLQGLGIGQAAKGDVPHADLTSEGLVDYGAGLVSYGLAWPADLDAGQPVESAAWDGSQAFQWFPSDPVQLQP